MNLIQVEDAGVYHAKVKSSIGEHCSSFLTLDVEPGPAWSATLQEMRSGKLCTLVSEHYGAKMSTIEAESKEEGNNQSRMLGLQNSWGGNGWFPPKSPTGWIEGTVGSWEMKTPSEERKQVEADGDRAIVSYLDRSILKRYAKYNPDAMEGRRFAVTENVLEAIYRIRMEKDMDLNGKLEANLKAVHQQLNGKDDWPGRNLIKTKEKMLVGTSLNHTWQTHLWWEQDQADAWRKSFDEDPVGMLRWNGLRSKRQQSNLNTCDSDTFSSESSDSMSSSDSEEERLPKSVRSLGINFDAEPMSVRLGDEEQGEETSDEEEEEDAVSRLQGLLLSNHDEDKVTKSKKKIFSDHPRPPSSTSNNLLEPYHFYCDATDEWTHSFEPLI